MGTRDWNDGMNRVGAGGKGESVWLGWFLHTILGPWAALSAGRDAARASWRRRADALKASLEGEGWDGDWYRRAYFDDGTPLGAAVNDACHIDSIAQSWSVLSGAADHARGRRAMAAVDQHLVRRLGEHSPRRRREDPPDPHRARKNQGERMKRETLPLNDGSRLNGIRVLVVDDTPYVLAVVTEILEQGGATVTAVGSAEEALAALQSGRPDVLLSDLAMPGRGGYWLIGQVRALPPEAGGTTPAAALTAYASPEHRASVLRAGFQYHVEKPVGVRELIGVVANLVEYDAVVTDERTT